MGGGAKGFFTPPQQSVRLLKGGMILFLLSTTDLKMVCLPFLPLSMIKTMSFERKEGVLAHSMLIFYHHSLKNWLHQDIFDFFPQVRGSAY